VINYLKILDLVFEDDVAQRCWSILNDMYVSSPILYHLLFTFILERKEKERKMLMTGS